MNIDEYIIFDWKGDSNIQPLTKSKSKKLYSIFLESKDNRIHEFQKLLGKNIKLDFSENSLDYIWYWLCDEVKKSNFYKNYPPIKDQTTDFINGSYVPPIFRSIANDISIYIAEMWFIKIPELEWKLVLSNSVEGSNHPGITGFPQAVKNFTYPITYYIYKLIYAIAAGYRTSSNRSLIRQYCFKLPEYKGKGLGHLPKLPEDLLQT
jgi:hypothetical protein